MREELIALWELQELDVEIAKLESEKNRIPEKIRQASDKISSKEREQEAKQKSLEEHNEQRRKLEQEIQSSRDTIAKYKSQLLQVKTNKEYQSLLHEINIQETKISAYEEEIIEHLTKIDDCSEAIEKLKEDLANRRAKFMKYKEQMDNRLSKIETLLVQKKAERTHLASKISKLYLSRYEQISRSRSGIGLVEISDLTCNGCNAVLPPQFIAEVKKGDRILTCEQCGRILIWRE